MEAEAKIPPGFVSLQEVPHRTDVISIMGLVEDYLPPTKSGGSDYMSKMELRDPTIVISFPVKYFRPLAAQLPCVQGPGDVVMIHDIKIAEWRGVKCALSCRQTEWTVFHAASIPQEQPKGKVELPYRESKGARRPTPMDFRYAIHLSSLMDRDRLVKMVELGPNGTPPEPVPAPDPKKKAALIKDIEDFRFYNITAQVVKTFGSKGGIYELDVTDYTANKQLYNHERPDEEAEAVGRDGDEFAYLPRSRRKQRAAWQWTGPLGKMTLHVTLFEPHASYAQEKVKEGDFILLRNLHVRFGRKNGQFLEGVLHTDKRYSDLIDIEVLEDRSDDRVKEVLKRKLEYRKKQKKRLRGTLDVAETPQKRPRSKEPGEVEPELPQPKREANSKKKGNKPKETKEEAKKVEEARKQEITKEEAPASIKVMRGSELTRNVRCTHPAMRTLPVAEIINGKGHETTSPGGVAYTLPFHNICCRARVRVVDFYPPNLADFAVPCRVSEYDVLSDAGNDSNDSDSEASSSPAPDETGSIRWEWRFCLLLEDAQINASNGNHSRIKVFVSQNDADYLLGLEAEDLRKNPRALAELTERLFLLWGELAERKAASNTRTALQEVPPNKKRNAAALSAKQGKENTPGPAGPVFECCLKEYGVRVRRGKEFVWERRYQMFGTTII
ncbi:MAG: hypothetical protein M1823_003523 [Watsoniomyces obsoletus]|nr:MAG: hypothetical protein M1823_003523 [Watsoniomyces obsoletus]